MESKADLERTSRIQRQAVLRNQEGYRRVESTAKSENQEIKS